MNDYEERMKRLALSGSYRDFEMYRNLYTSLKKVYHLGLFCSGMILLLAVTGVFVSAGYGHMVLTFIFFFHSISSVLKTKKCVVEAEKPFVEAKLHMLDMFRSLGAEDCCIIYNVKRFKWWMAYS